MSIRIQRVQFEHRREPLGIGESKPRLSWRLKGDAKNWFQTAYEVEIASLEKPQLPVKTYKVASSESILVPWPGEPLQSCESAAVRIRVFGRSHDFLSPSNQGEVTGTDWSEPAIVETGFLDRNDWNGCSLITADGDIDITLPRQPVLFRRGFELQQPATRARIYITAQGLYEAHLNGVRIGDHVLAPGWTSYKHHLAYQTFDIMDLLHVGENVLAVQVAEGWYCGRLGFMGGERNIWGQTMGLVAKVIIESASPNTKTVITTDGNWKSSTGSLITSEIYDGEVCDLSLEPKGWFYPGFSRDDSWKTVKTLSLPTSKLVSPEGPPVRKVEELKAKKLLTTPSGKTVVDFGQNIVGWVRLQLTGPKGSVLKLQFVEVLDKGEVATRPLRICKASDTITLSGQDQTWEPKFTFHGFRYVQIDGWPEEGKPLDLSTATAIIVHTDMEQTGFFECSNQLLNQLHNNIRWGMRGNFLSIPTDCPQRDERLGWTGDIYAFAPAANYLYNTCGMLQSWVKDLAAEQFESETKVPPFFCPNVFPRDTRYPTAIWGDVVVSLPWDLYMSYGDRRILHNQMESMQGWIEEGIVRDDQSRLWKEDSYQFGDWLDPKAPPDEPGNSVTDPLLVANAYLCHITSLMKDIYDVLGLTDLSEQYEESAIQVKTAFQERYITPTGRVASDSQTALALCIHFQLFASESQQAVAVARLRTLILQNSRFKIATGFAGTHIIGHALTRVNESQLFYRMLYHRKAPSWLYQVTMGATTMWERWDSMLPDGSINPGEMTSFNHYALGAVADWMHKNIAGLKLLEPGWRKFRVAPIPGGDLTNASACFLSPYGEITTCWSITAGIDGSVSPQFLLAIKVPPNTTAEVVLPASCGDSDTFTVGSGSHEFRTSYTQPAWPPIPIYPQYYPHNDDEP